MLRLFEVHHTDQIPSPPFTEIRMSVFDVGQLKQLWILLLYRLTGTLPEQTEIALGGVLVSHRLMVSSYSYHSSLKCSSGFHDCHDNSGSISNYFHLHSSSRTCFGFGALLQRSENGGTWCAAVVVFRSLSNEL